MNNDDEKKTILLVEDEAIIAMSEKMKLEEKGYIVHHVNTGEEAVKAVLDNAHTIDLILMDIDLGPGIDGTQAAEEILNQKDIPVVFLSSHIEPDIVEKTEKITSYGYVVKSSSIVVLDASIKMALKLFESKMAHKQKEEDLRESEYKYRMLFENMNVSFALHEAIYDEKGNPVDFRYLDMNPKFLDNLGSTASAIRGHTVSELFPNTEQYWIDTFGEVAKTGKSVSLQNYSCELNQWFNTFVFSPQKNQFASFFIDITEQKMVEESLKDSEFRKHSYFEQAPYGIFISNNKGEYLEVNPGACELTGYSEKELTKMRITDLLFEEDHEAGLKHFRKLKESGNAYGETRFLKKDGTTRWWSVAAVKISDDLLLGFCEDITERKQAEEALRKFKTISDNAVYGKAISNLQGELLYVNQFFANIHGYEPEELIGKNLAVFHKEQQMDTVHNLIASLIQEDNFKAATVWHCHKDGTEFPMLMSGILMRDDYNNPQYLATSAIDITAQLQAEEDYRMTIYELKKSQEVARVGSWVWHILQNRVEWSDEMYRIFGIDKEQFTGDLNQLVNDCIHPDDRAEVNRSNTSVMEQNAPIPVEYRIIRPDGSIRTVWAEAGELELDESGKPVLLRGIVLDITERKRAEEEIKKQLSEKETLLQEVHHRVKNNIANIEGLLSLQASSNSNPELKAALQDSISRVQSMRVLYEKLLVSKETREISMKDYAEDLTDSIHEVFDRKDKITIEKSIADFEINARKAITVGIIINELMTNIFKYAFKDRNRGTVSVSIEKNDRMVTIIIQDNGIGIDERIMENKSPGFGLTIVKMLVEQLNGTYSIVNKNGTKSVIRFEI